MAAEEPRWLSAEQQTVWRSWLLARDRIERVLDAELRPHGLDLAEYEILVCLSEAPQRQLRMSELAAQVHQSRSRLTHTIGRMETDALVRRERAPRDGRGVLAVLTNEGLDLLVRVAPAHVASVRRVFVDAVDPDDFTAVGRAMRAVLDAEAEA
ncbi:MAG: MarR family transcriptional regulator [Actinomycetia bacterium]|nr:MarR family transcriptional regulator [Actinomycetes bacterium]